MKKVLLLTALVLVFFGQSFSQPTQSSNSRYYMLNGSECPLIGTNTWYIGYRRWGMNDSESEFKASMDSVFSKMTDHSIYVTRIFLNMPRQWDTSNDKFNSSDRSHIELVRDSLSANNIKAIVTIFNENWDWQLSGGDTVAGVQWTDAQCEVMIDSCVSIWGNSSALGWWDLCNDLELSRDPEYDAWGRTPSDTWVNDMEPYLRTADSNHDIFIQIPSYLSWNNFSHATGNIDGLSFRHYESSVANCIDEAWNDLNTNYSIETKPIYMGEFAYTGGTSSYVVFNTADTVWVGDSNHAEAFLHSIWIVMSGGGAGTLPWIEGEKGTTYPDLNETEWDYYKVLSDLMVDTVKAGQYNMTNSNSNSSCSDGDVEDYSIQGSNNDRMLCYLYNPVGDTITPNVTVSGFVSDNYTINYYNPTTGALVDTDTFSGTSSTESVPSFSDSIVLLIHNGEEPDPPSSPSTSRRRAIVCED